MKPDELSSRDLLYLIVLHLECVVRLECVKRVNTLSVLTTIKYYNIKRKECEKKKNNKFGFTVLSNTKLFVQMKSFPEAIFV